MENHKFAKIKDNEKLVRDATSNAVLNTDMSSLEQYRARRDSAAEQQKEFETLKKEVSEIKQLLFQLVNRD
jgi:phosphoenolpyruvate-protein kinase (PTS system EI component)